MREPPRLPAADIGLDLRVRGPKPVAGPLGAEILHDGVRFPGHEVAIDQGRDHMIRIERHELRPHLLAPEEIDGHELAVQTEVIEHGEDPAGIGRGREVVELHLNLVCGSRTPRPREACSIIAQ